MALYTIYLRKFKLIVVEFLLYSSIFYSFHDIVLQTWACIVRHVVERLLSITENLLSQQIVLYDALRPY